MEGELGSKEGAGVEVLLSHSSLSLKQCPNILFCAVMKHHLRMKFMANKYTPIQNKIYVNTHTNTQTNRHIHAQKHPHARTHTHIHTHSRAHKHTNIYIPLSHRFCLCMICCEGEFHFRFEYLAQLIGVHNVFQENIFTSPKRSVGRYISSAKRKKL